LRWLGTAGFRIEADGTALLIDPFLSRSPGARPPRVVDEAELFPAQAIFATHGHFDHAFDVPGLATRHRVPVHADASVTRNLVLRGVPADLMRPIGRGFSERIGPFTVAAHPTRHVWFGLSLVFRTLWRMGWRAPLHLPLGLFWPCGQPHALRLTVDGRSIVHVGTAGATEPEVEALAAAGPIDLLLMALQGHDRIHEIAGGLVVSLAPRIVIPHHQDDFYPPISQQVAVEPFVELVRRQSPATQVRVIVPGETFRLETLLA
jgi:L-ascorbate metabolism protein UlaG (beta-lactamase superfamily)